MKTKISLVQNAKNWLFSLSLIFAFSWAVQAQTPVYVQNTSSPNACDGSAILDSTFASLPIVWINSGAMGTTLATDTYWVYGLCPGDYIVTFNTPNGSMTVTFTVGSGSANPCAGFGAFMTTTPTDPNACTGTAEITYYGGTGPYTFSCANLPSLTNLCEGPISCMVVDASGCTANVSGYVLEDNGGGGGTNDTVIVILNNTFPPNSVTDSLPTMSIVDCTIDFDSIGSAMITNVQSNPSGLVVTWTVYDLNGGVMATYDLTYAGSQNAGIYQATLILICGRSINMVEITDQFEYTPGSANITENEDLQFSLVNPIQDQLNIQFNSTFEGQLTLVDMKGSTIFTQAVNASNFQYDASHLNAGVYVLQVQSTKGVSSVRLVK